MPIEPPVTTTLTQGEFTLLHSARFQRFTVAITAISNADLGGALLRTSILGGRKVKSSVGTEVTVRVFQSVIGGATVEASTPEGVGSVEITYEVRTGSDA